MADSASSSSDESSSEDGIINEPMPKQTQYYYSSSSYYSSSEDEQVSKSLPENPFQPTARRPPSSSSDYSSTDEDPGACALAYNDSSSDYSIDSEDESIDDKSSEPDYTLDVEAPKPDSQSAPPNQSKVVINGDFATVTPNEAARNTCDSKTLFIGNLPFDVTKQQLDELFQKTAKVVNYRLAFDCRQKFRKFAHVEFASAEEANKAMILDGSILNGNIIKLDYARERSSQGLTVFVRGFDRSKGESKIRTEIHKHFACCGKITRITIPHDYNSGFLRGFAFIEFKDDNSFKNALEMNESQLGQDWLTVEEARRKTSAVEFASFN